MMKLQEKLNNPASKLDLDKLVEEYQPKLKAFIRKQVGNSDEADDILQDVFYQLIKTLEDTFNPIEHVSGWLYRVARNLIINKGKKKKEEELPFYQEINTGNEITKEFSEVLFNNEYSPSPEFEYLRSIVWTELENALSELPLEQREIFELTELDGIPVKEISKTTGVPVNTLLSRKHYAVLHLRERLAGLYNEIVNS
jgi:RNA polymerase sigma factor (sigma-70 family)